jgi:hypothetical protein
MKERIRLLAEQTHLIDIIQEHHNEFGHGDIHDYSDLEKFAELIVEECVQTLNTEIDRLCEYKNSLSEYSNHSKREDVDLVVEKCHDNIQMIKQHFGVEE